MSQLQMAEEMQRGAITADTYVWKDGMADWLSVGQVPELAALLARAVPAAAAYAPQPAAPVQDEPHMGLAGTVVMSESPAISPFAAPRPAAGAPAAAATPAPAAGLAPVNQPTTAARRANRPAGGSVDVFAAAAEKQPEARPDRPKPPTPAGRLGERNENSVLFSLSALTATESAAAKPKDDAVVDLGLGNGKGKSAVDDLMSIGGGAIGGPMLAPPPLLAPVVEPPPAPAPVAAAPAVMPSMSPAASFEPMPPQKKSKTGLIVGIVVGVLAIGGVGAFAALGGGGGAPTADTAAPASAATSAPAATSAAPTNTVTSAPADAPAASGAPAASSAVVASNDTSKAPPSTGAGGPSTKASSAASSTPSTKASAEPTPTPTASAAPTATDTGGGGGRDFNKGAATTALAAAASAAKGCKQPGGPTGSASVRVVFAPSGNVTSANVQGPPFAGTPVGGCIASAFRGAHVPPFDGSPVAVSKTVNIN